MKISKDKKDKISEQILLYLFSITPRAAFTSHIAKEIARDEEFIKRILMQMKSDKFVVEIKKNPKGKDYVRRSRWKLSEKTQNIYKKLQSNKNP